MLSLGISCNHDSGVSVLHDENIIFAANEERYTRKKFDSGFPENALLEA
ncbi:MAG: carbamoyltransferase N-terminal domain-containing protein, partial [Actinomycetota bacterium]